MLRILLSLAALALCGPASGQTNSTAPPRYELTVALFPSDTGVVAQRIEIEVRPGIPFSVRTQDATHKRYEVTGTLHQRSKRAFELDPFKGEVLDAHGSRLYTVRGPAALKLGQAEGASAIGFGWGDSILLTNTLGGGGAEELDTMSSDVTSSARYRLTVSFCLNFALRHPIERIELGVRAGLPFSVRVVDNAGGTFEVEGTLREKASGALEFKPLKTEVRGRGAGLQLLSGGPQEVKLGQFDAGGAIPLGWTIGTLLTKKQ